MHIINIYVNIYVCIPQYHAHALCDKHACEITR